MSTSRQRRLISALLLVCFSFAFAAPVFALQASQPATMACCKNGRASCCHSRKRTKTGWTAAATCPRHCGMPAATQFAADSVLSPESFRTAELVWNHIAPLAEQVHARSSFYLAFLYQLPPPAPAL